MLSDYDNSAPRPRNSLMKLGPKFKIIIFYKAAVTILVEFRKFMDSLSLNESPPVVSRAESRRGL
jgi:hypothetical protein